MEHPGILWDVGSVIRQFKAKEVILMGHSMSKTMVLQAAGDNLNGWWPGSG